jgi:subtilisin family serine protease
VTSRRTRALRSCVIAIVLGSMLVAPATTSAKEPRHKEIGPIPTSGKNRPHAKLAKPAPVRQPTRLIVKFRESATTAGRSAVRTANGFTKVRSLGIIHAEVVTPRRGESADAAARRLKQDRRVEYAVPDYYRQLYSNPVDEPYYGSQWGLNNTGQTIGGYPGNSNVDIDATEAFAITQGSPTVTVAVIDDGVDFGHPDLAGQAWVNPGESGPDDLGGDKATNGIDDDGNDLIDDVNGWDFCNGDASVHDVDEDEHGTGVAGVIAGAVNGEGITGVAPGIRIMALKFIDDFDCGSDTDAISAIEYASAHGAQIANASWGFAGYSPALQDAIEASGMLFVAAAGNGGEDGVGDNIDFDPVFPAALPSANLITVAAIHNGGYPTYYTNYGPTSVDLSAPGDDVLVAVPAGEGGPATWEFRSGTSYAAPHVAGVAALLASVHPDLLSQPTVLRAQLLDEAWVLATTVGLTATGGVVEGLYGIDHVPPTASAPSTKVVAPATLGTTTAVVAIAWPKPTDANSGIDGYVLQQSTNGGATWTSISGTGTVTSTNRSLVIGTTYRFRILAVDEAGNATVATAPSVQPVRYQENSTTITYRGIWTRWFLSGASGSYTKYATRSTSSATYRFTGRSVGLVAPMSRSRGSFKVYVDGLYIKTISLYSTTTKARQVVFTRTWIANGVHTVKVVPVGTAGHPRVDIDAFVILR